MSLDSAASEQLSGGMMMVTMICVSTCVHLYVLVCACRGHVFDSYFVGNQCSFKDENFTNTEYKNFLLLLTVQCFINCLWNHHHSQVPCIASLLPSTPRSEILNNVFMEAPP